MIASTFHALHRWNALLCPPIGLLSNFALILLVLTKTPKEMRQHSRILLQTGIADILLLLLTTFGQPAISYRQNTLIVLFNGYFIECFSDDHSLLIYFNIWFLFSLFDIFGLVVQFIYRYLVLNRDVKINLCQYLQMLMVIFIVVCVLSWLSYLTSMASKTLTLSNSSSEEKQSLLALLLSNKNGSIKYFARIVEKNFLAKTWDYASITISSICYGIIAFCSLKISRYINSQLDGRKKELSKQLSRNLIIMAILPLLLILLNITIMTTNILSTKRNEKGDENTNVNNNAMGLEMTAIMLLTHWLPVLNPLVSIVTNTPYRKALLLAINRISPTRTNTI